MSLTQEPQLAILNGSSKLLDILIGVSVSNGPNDAFMPVVLNSQGVLDPTITSVKIFEATFHLTAANLLALRATPITVIPAPAAGKFIRVTQLTAQYKFNSLAFTVGADNLGFRYVGGASDFAGIPVTGLIDQTHSEIALQSPNASFQATQTGVNGVAVQVHNTGAAEWTTGNGDVFLTLLYEVVTLN